MDYIGLKKSRDLLTALWLSPTTSIPWSVYRITEHLKLKHRVYSVYRQWVDKLAMSGNLINVFEQLMRIFIPFLFAQQKC